MAPVTGTHSGAGIDPRPDADFAPVRGFGPMRRPSRPGSAGRRQTERIGMASKVANGTDTVENRDEAVEGALLDTLSAAVKKLVARGRERGYVTYDELNA